MLHYNTKPYLENPIATSEAEPSDVPLVQLVNGQVQGVGYIPTENTRISLFLL